MLEKFEKENKRKKQIVFFTILCVFLITGVFLYQTFALFETKEHFNLVSGSTEDPGDLYFAYYIDGEISLEIPSIDSWYVLTNKSTCTNGVSITWDEDAWIATLDYSNYRPENKSKTKCNLYFEKGIYREKLLKESYPVLEEGLIPVTIEDDGTVKKADLKEKWYSYKEKKWANAVILKDETKEYQNNEVILENDIESYFVWIPKYRYQLWNLENDNGLTEVDETKVRTIPVLFGDYNTSDSVRGECTTPMTSGNIGNCSVGDYVTHPAFLSIPSTGFWVGKFETSKGNTNADNSVNPSGVQIKPNVSSWRSIQVANAFYTSYNYKRNFESHMMKNTEWGAVAYLSHSEYGSRKSVRINNNSNYITGYASVNEPTCGNIKDNGECNKYGTTEDITLPYHTEKGVLASTTGNISGIYDMAGGAWEYVMGIMIDINGNPLSGQSVYYNSGFIGNYGSGDSSSTGYSWPEEKYYDKYQNGTSYSDYTRLTLGDATSEMGTFESDKETNELISSWYADCAYFVASVTPWFVRGGLVNEGTETGVFAFSANAGSAHDIFSFRIVLNPKKT